MTAMDAGSPAAAERNSRWIAPVMVVLCGVIAYWNCFGGQLFFDDINSLVYNPDIHNLIPNLRSVETNSISGRPVAQFLFALEYAASGGSPLVVFHTTNLLIHVCCGLLLYGIVRRNLSNRDFWGDRFAGSARWLGAAVGMLWVTHPLNTESVTYIVQRTEALASLFYLWVIYCLIRRAEGGGWGWELAGVLGCALGMGSKEMMVTGPVMALLYDRTFLSGSFKGALKVRGRLYAGLACTWVVLGLLMATNGRGKSVGFEQGISVRDYARTQLGVIAHYLRLAIWPNGLVLDEYGWPIAHGWSEITWGWGVAGMGIGTRLALWKKPWVGFLGMWLFVILSPSSSVVPIVTEIAAEHRMYLPLAGVVALVVVGGWEIFQRVGMQAVAVGAGCVVLVGLTATTLARNQDYHSALNLWRGVLAGNPANPRAHLNVGLALAEQGETTEAAREYCEALEIKPKFFIAASELGHLLMQRGKGDLAERFYAHQNDDPEKVVGEAFLVLGSLYGEQQDWGRAKEAMQTAARYLPDDATVRDRLAEAQRGGATSR
jgi:protein O-mannosyl-transferase